MEPVGELVALKTRSPNCSLRGWKQSGRRSPLPLLNANPQNGDQKKCNNQCGLKSFGHRQSLSPLRPDHSKLNRTFTFAPSIESNPYPGTVCQKSIGCNHEVRRDHPELNTKTKLKRFKENWWSHQSVFDPLKLQKTQTRISHEHEARVQSLHPSRWSLLMSAGWSAQHQYLVYPFWMIDEGSFPSVTGRSSETTLPGLDISPIRATRESTWSANIKILMAIRLPISKIRYECIKSQQKLWILLLSIVHLKFSVFYFQFLELPI